MLNPDRYFDPTPGVREIARGLYERVAQLPLVCPHGHVDPRMLAEDTPFPDPARLLVIPDHYVTRMLYSQGIALERLGCALARRHAGRNRSAEDLAALRRSLSSLPRHAERLLAEARARRRLRHRRTPDQRQRTGHLRPHRGAAPHAGVPPARAVRSVQASRCCARPTPRPTRWCGISGFASQAGRARSGPRSAPIWRSTSCIPTGRRKSTGSARSRDWRSTTYGQLHRRARGTVAPSSNRWARPRPIMPR